MISEDRGSVSLVAVAVVAVAAVLVGVVATAGALGAAASRAQGAADACALAAAAEARDLRALGGPGSGGACDKAEAVADAWRVGLGVCSVDRWGRVTVRVWVGVAGISVDRSARAGPQ